MSTALTLAAALVAASGAGLLYWALWRRRSATAKACQASVQEATIVVNGGYRPDRVVVRAGMPVRLNFVRNEDNPCSEWVIFSAFNIRRRLAAYRTTMVELAPSLTGEFLFTCQFGVYRGNLVVRDGPGKKLSPVAHPSLLSTGSTFSSTGQGRRENREAEDRKEVKQ